MFNIQAFRKRKRPKTVPPAFSGSIDWNFGGTDFTVIPLSLLNTGSVLRLSYRVQWTLAAGGSIDIGAYSDPSFTTQIGSPSGVVNGSGGPNDYTYDFPLAGGYIVQNGTNFTGNYTSPGTNGVTGIITVNPA